MPSYSYPVVIEPDVGRIEAAIYASPTLSLRGLISVTWDGTQVTADFTSALDILEVGPDTTEGTFEHLVLNFWTPLVVEPTTVKLQAQQTGDNAIIVTSVPRRGKGVVAATMNWADRATWWYESTRVTDQVLVQNPSNPLEWGHALSNWINVTHGLIFDEYDLRTTYKAVVTVDGQVLTERLAHDMLWEGDYVIDYAQGTVKFREDHTGSTVTATFSYANGSNWVIKSTTPGAMVSITETEAQFSTDCRVHDTIQFQILGYAAFFATQHVIAEYLQPDDLVPLKTYSYDTIDQLVDRAKGSVPVIPPIGGERGMAHGRIVYVFPYDDVFELSHALGLQLSIKLENDVKMTGERATATCYGSLFKDNPVATLMVMLNLDEATASALYAAGASLLNP